MICTSSDFLLLAFRSELFVTDVHNYSTPTAWNFDLEGVWASRSQWEGVSTSKALDMTHFCIWFILILSSELMHRFDAVQPFRRFLLSRRSQSRGAMRSARGTCQTFFLFFGFVDFVVGNVENVPNSTSLLGWWWLKPGQVHDSRPRAPAESRQGAHTIECVCGRSAHTHKELKAFRRHGNRVGPIKATHLNQLDTVTAALEAAAAGNKVALMCKFATIYNCVQRSSAWCLPFKDKPVDCKLVHQCNQLKDFACSKNRKRRGPYPSDHPARRNLNRKYNSEKPCRWQHQA